MTKLTLDENEYEIDDMTDEQKEILNILNVGSNASALLNHISQCVTAIQQMKTNELKQSLEGSEDDQSE
jgi:hypothetical protein|tara:strand:- start:564 stop:770 length:207 start_codon:yes stop_codon:yes gene_type:complete